MTLPSLLDVGMPHIVVSGNAYDRGYQYGELARERILRSIALYRGVFQYRAQLSWASAVAMAQSFVPSITGFAPACLEEMHGIADGAGIDRGDIFALNARSELMFAALGANRAATMMATECTSFAAMPEATSNGHTFVGQNWDWVPGVLDTSVLLEVHRTDGPSFITVAEAGHLAKIGFNAAGIGVCTNTLVSAGEPRTTGVPYHVMLRTLLDATNMTDAARTLLGPQRAFAGNYVVAHKDGLGINAETTPGGSAGVKITMPEHGVLAHANHFLCHEFAPRDGFVATAPHSLFRHDCMRRAMCRDDHLLTVNDLMSTLRSHQNHPDGICAHPDPRVNPYGQRTTVASIFADLTAGTFWFTAGPPCKSEYQRVDYATRLRHREAAPQPNAPSATQFPPHLSSSTSGELQ